MLSANRQIYTHLLSKVKTHFIRTHLLMMEIITLPNFAEHWNIFLRISYIKVSCLKAVACSLHRMHRVYSPSMIFCAVKAWMALATAFSVLLLSELQEICVKYWQTNWKRTTVLYWCKQTEPMDTTTILI